MDLIMQARPFNRILQGEVDRVAYIYTANDTTGKYCAAILSGGECKSDFCKRCAPQPNLPLCRRCETILFRGHCYMLWCRHLICKRCIHFLPTKVEAIMLYECPACGVFGDVELLFG
uniref:RING-type domain-containing protein n=1 Tax=Photinus pyralis TaxID=7054 RepID=A0A1Y1KPG2_PHOPY